MKNYYKIIVILLFIFLSMIKHLAGQENLSLEMIHAIWTQDSYQKVQAENNKKIAIYENEIFQGSLKPQLGVRLNLPNYIKTSSGITQPDGTIAFQPIRQNNSSITLLASQVIKATGGQIFMTSDLQRFDDYSSDIRQFNGIPIRIGISQKLFGFNSFKYQDQIQKISVSESTKQFQSSIEEGLSICTQLYFNILIAKQNLEIAESNEAVNQSLMIITQERFQLGKISKDELLQLEIELNQAKLAVSQAKSDVQKSESILFGYLGNKISTSEPSYTVPEVFELPGIELSSLFAAFEDNKPEIESWKRRQLELESDFAQTKEEMGFQANLQASIGLARGSEQVSKIYTDPFDEQQISLSISVPLVDWGQRKNSLSRISILQENLSAEKAQGLEEFKNEIEQKLFEIKRLENDLVLLKVITLKAEERFQISNERYILGDVNLTELTLAQRDRDQTKRNFISSLRLFWTNYYDLRALTGYDIQTNQTIQYK